MDRKKCLYYIVVLKEWIIEGLYYMWVNEIFNRVDFIIFFDIYYLKRI